MAETGLATASVLLATDFYASFPEEMDALIYAEKRAAEKVHRWTRRRERLLSS